MNNLRKRIFITLISILSSFLVVLILIFNVSLYNTERSRSIDFATRFEPSENFFAHPDDNLPNNKELIFLNDKIAKKHLTTSLILSLVIGSAAEILIIYASRIIAKWIVDPVEETFEKQKQFISDASHELKTPLTIIQASTEILEEKPNEKKYVSNIKTETVKMNKLVNSLLELSRTDNLETKKVYSTIDLSKLVKNKSLSFESLMFENKMTLETNIEPNIKFNCDGEKIKELLGILLDNAIKYGDKNSKISVGLLRNKNEIILSVKNKGNEIPKAEREKIFERFYRVDKSRNRKEGSYGLGLAIAKNITEIHHGKIRVECENGFTIFSVTFKI